MSPSPRNPSFAIDFGLYRASAAPARPPNSVTVYSITKFRSTAASGSREERAPRGDDECVSHHRGADAAGLIFRAPAEPAHGSGDDRPLPVRKVTEPEMHEAEQNRGDDQRAGAAAQPFLQPSLEHAAEEELLAERQDP